MASECGRCSASWSSGFRRPAQLQRQQQQQQQRQQSRTTNANDPNPASSKAKTLNREILLEAGRGRAILLWRAHHLNKLGGGGVVVCSPASLTRSHCMGLGLRAFSTWKADVVAPRDHDKTENDAIPKASPILCCQRQAALSISFICRVLTVCAGG